MAAPASFRAPSNDPEYLNALVRDLRRLARRLMSGERPDHTLQPTALVNEAVIRVMSMNIDWSDRRLIIRTLSRLMRNVLVDHARKHRAGKRFGKLTRVELTEQTPAPDSLERVLALDEALNSLADSDARAAGVFELIYFGGLSEEETAETLEISARTVKRDVAFARAWLKQRR
jgi:RNA polymerase sigma factor (TIGR02999 family)